MDVKRVESLQARVVRERRIGREVARRARLNSVGIRARCPRKRSHREA